MLFTEAHVPKTFPNWSFGKIKVMIEIEEGIKRPVPKPNKMSKYFIIKKFWAKINNNRATPDNKEDRKIISLWEKSLDKNCEKKKGNSKTYWKNKK